MGDIWAVKRENLSLVFANNKGADQPGHLIFLASVCSGAGWFESDCRKPSRQVLLRQSPYTLKAPLNSHADVSTKARGLNFGLSLYLHLYFVYASSKG